MKTTITTYEYSYITQQVNNLTSAYLAVNDAQIRLAIRAKTIAQITPLLPSESLDAQQFLTGLATDRLSRTAATKLLELLVPLVEPFPTLSTKQLSKIFRKVKKLKQPEWANLQLHELTYLGWNDGGNQKKYLVAPFEDRLIGIQGEFSPQTIKGVCAICQTIGNVALFLSTTKSSGLGTYTKKGNYICRDSNQCNRQLTNLETLTEFLTVVQPQRRNRK
ncbi:FusB/FusC family EF-G-binding protein [Lactiplantibacillus sp. WILCCON 0030]|uniref:FusB/FusC family EF-G-binding protein n=1 Tax=Lactiplantibacillus brownii TaxID=3069269 RepID=A0ABU1A4Y4_9LACO|nr:FusB/FusC family EF-G-binding protein [Lactiplantibacillus brownii]MDQ7936070.1 FusB/FusC family EF-G-binding protein [Lactiplantibacillus brownii]